MTTVSANAAAYVGKFGTPAAASPPRTCFRVSQVTQGCAHRVGGTGHLQWVAAQQLGENTSGWRRRAGKMSAGGKRARTAPRLVVSVQYSAPPSTSAFTASEIKPWRSSWPLVKAMTSATRRRRCRLPGRRRTGSLPASINRSTNWREIPDSCLEPKGPGEVEALARAVALGSAPILPLQFYRRTTDHIGAV